MPWLTIDTIVYRSIINGRSQDPLEGNHAVDATASARLCPSPAHGRLKRSPRAAGTAAAQVSIGLLWATVVEAASTAGARLKAAPAGGATAIFDHGGPPAGIAQQPLIKMVFLLVKPEGMGDARFHQYWLQQHAPLVRSLAGDMRARRYIQSHLIPSPTADAATKVRGLEPNPYQGFAEVWWDSEDEMADAFARPAGAEAGAKLLEDEKKFLDDRTLILMTREYLIFDRTWIGRAGAVTVRQACANTGRR
jgi:uncharacterized protein (TIGR02118 family)